MLSADNASESTLQTELMEIQERWRHAHHHLDQQRRELHGLLKVRIQKSNTASVLIFKSHNYHHVAVVDVLMRVVSGMDVAR